MVNPCLGTRDSFPWNWKTPPTAALPTGGLRDESTVHRATVKGVVDTGAVMLVLPENVVAGLGLET